MYLVKLWKFTEHSAEGEEILIIVDPSIKKVKEPTFKEVVKEVFKEIFNIRRYTRCMR
jgi:hypothetical protein